MDYVFFQNYIKYIENPSWQYLIILFLVHATGGWQGSWEIGMGRAPSLSHSITAAGSTVQQQGLLIHPDCHYVSGGGRASRPHNLYAISVERCGLLYLSVKNSLVSQKFMTWAHCLQIEIIKVISSSHNEKIWLETGSLVLKLVGSKAVDDTFTFSCQLIILFLLWAKFFRESFSYFTIVKP